MHCTNYYESTGFLFLGGGLESLLPPSPLKDTQECMQDNPSTPLHPPPPPPPPPYFATLQFHPLLNSFLNETLEYMLKLGNTKLNYIRMHQVYVQSSSNNNIAVRPQHCLIIFSSSGNEAKWCSIATGKNGNKKYRHRGATALLVAVATPVSTHCSAC